MHPQSHFVLSWLTGCQLSHWRDRALVAWSGIAPDLDGLTVLAGEDAYGRWHHTLTHGACAAVMVALAAAWIARHRVRVFWLSLIAFHLHLVCDLLGSGREWGIRYLYPFHDYEITSSIGWSLASWQNVSITAFALMLCVVLALRLERTFVEACLPRSVDRAVVSALIARFGRLSARRVKSSPASRPPSP